MFCFFLVGMHLCCQPVRKQLVTFCSTFSGWLRDRNKSVETWQHCVTSAIQLYRCGICVLSNWSNTSFHASLRVDETQSLPEKSHKRKTKGQMFSEWCFCVTDTLIFNHTCQFKLRRLTAARSAGRKRGGVWGHMGRGGEWERKKKRKNGELSHFLSKKKVSVFTFSRRGNDRMGLPKVHRLFSHFFLLLAITASSAANQHTPSPLKVAHKPALAIIISAIQILLKTETSAFLTAARNNDK